MMYGYGFDMGIWMIVGWVIMAAVIVFALYGLMVLLRKSDPGSFSGKSMTPVDILKERLAKGEISSEEYHKIREELLK